MKRYRRTLAVDEVSLCVNRGEIYGLIGPDGAGKSTLLKACAGVLAFDGGRVEVLGATVDSERSAEAAKARLGFMPQGLGLNLYPELSVEENVDFFARLRLVPAKLLAERKQRLLALTRLAAFRDRPMKHLSGGMKQKLALVCTLVHDPDLVILDEPTTGVDPVSRRDFWSILNRLIRERGVSALVSTAYMDEAARFHRLSMLFGGKALVSGTPDQILAEAPGTVVTLTAEPQLEARRRLLSSVTYLEALGRTLRAFVADSGPEDTRRTVLAALGDDLRVADISTESPDLEDAFVRLLAPGRLTRDHAGEPLAPGEGEPARDMAIEADSLVRDFGAFRAVDQVTFRVQQGEVFGLLGANGAGKTTVIKMLTGLLAPTTGRGRVAGADLQVAGPLVRERIGYMSQAFSLYVDLTARENLELFAGIYGLPGREARQRIRHLISLAQLEGHERVQTSQLPLGVRQRLALATALLHRPQVLFLDEPTSGVDPLGRRRFWDILLALARQDRVAMLVTTHYMTEAEHCDHLALMHAGRIVASGSAQQLKRDLERDAGQPLAVEADQPMAALDLLRQEGFSGATLFGTKIHLLSRAPEQDASTLRRLLGGHGIELRSLSPTRLSLEDVFIHRILALEDNAGSADTDASPVPKEPR